MKKKIIKAWLLLTSTGEYLGEGQGSNEYFYTKGKAIQRIKRCNSAVGFKLGWKIVPIEIKILK